ncbi:MAG: hypothetical protein HC819_14840 [Cyclobacteriaceae bacterium]|nr:hypothetical protein [Cyclobacteriaceae bacterium]
MLQKTIILALILIAAASCKPFKIPDRVETDITIVETLRDTTVYLTDSASIRALVVCDSLGQVQIKEIQSLRSGKHIKPPDIKIIRISPVQSIIESTCKIDSQAVYLKIKDREINNMTTVTKTIIKKRPWTAWQKAQLWFGRLSFVGLIIYLGFVTGLFKMILKAIKPI